MKKEDSGYAAQKRVSFYRRVSYSVMETEEIMRREALRKKENQQKNKEYLLNFQKLLQQELDEKSYEVLQAAVFKKWEEFKYRRDHSLAIHDIINCLNGQGLLTDQVKQVVQACHERRVKI